MGIGGIKLMLIVLLVLGSVIFFVRCIDNESKKNAVGYEKFADSKTCIQCHKDIYTSFTHTNHFLTSQYASPQTVKGSFDSLHNRFYFNPAVYVAMEKKGDSIFQTAYREAHRYLTAPFNMVIGSGKRGQTFLFWNKNRLIQLPVSYFTATNEWVNSPGYSNTVVFNRPATSRCLECHSTFFEKTSDTAVYPEEFSKTNIILGVDCERCHGPAKEHVDYHLKNPNEKQAKFIALTSTLSRQQSLELCRFCHGGKLNKTAPSFSYTVGKPLNEYFSFNDSVPDMNSTDVHGNQYGMLSASKCFRKSEMTCSSCHNSHKNESGDKVYFSLKCQACHQPESTNFCSLKVVSFTDSLKKNCIDCHMPEQPSKAIMVLRQGESIPTSATMRSHFISIYAGTNKTVQKGSGK